MGVLVRFEWEVLGGLDSGFGVWDLDLVLGG